MKRVHFLVGCVAASMAGCSPTGPEREFDVLDKTFEPLRPRFNAAAGPPHCSRK